MMEKYIEHAKMSKRARREIDRSWRNTWGAMSPVTRKVESKKVYSRKKIRQEKDNSFFTESFYFIDFLIPKSFLLTEKAESI